MFSRLRKQELRHVQPRTQAAEIVDLIKSGNVDDVIRFMNARNLTGENFTEIDEKVYEVNGRTITPPTPTPIYRGSFVQLAASLGNVEMVKTLIAHGCSPREQAPRMYSQTQPIHIACRAGHLPVVKTLVEDYSVPVDAISDYRYRETPLYLLMCSRGPFLYPMAEYLLNAGADVNMSVSGGRSVLHGCASNSSAPPELMQLFLSYGADVNGRGGRPPLIGAAESGRADFVHMLVDAGANIEVTNGPEGKPYGSSQDEGWSPGRVWQSSFDTAFIVATYFNHLPVMKALHSRGANADNTNRLGNTALHEAAQSGKTDIARYLVLDIGVTLDKRNRCNETPFFIALKNMHVPIAKLLFEAGYDPIPEEMEQSTKDHNLKLNDFDPDDSDPDDPDPEKISEQVHVSEFVQELRELMSIPRSLRDQCVFRLRHQLHRNVPDAADSLPLPKKLRNLVKLTHL